MARAGAAVAPATLLLVLFAVAVSASGLLVPDERRGHSSDGAVLGIDLGTTHICVGVYRNGRVEIIPDENGGHMTPNRVAFHDNGWLVGEAALDDPSRAIHGVKRLIGKEFHDEDVQREMTRRLPYDVVDVDGKPCVRVVDGGDGDARVVSAEEITAAVLAKVKESAEAYLGRAVTSAVVAVPAHFGDEQRIATRAAGGIAGLDVMRIIGEPIAAASAYGIGDDARSSGKRVLVFHLGGSTLDVTALAVHDDGLFDVLATNGDAHLGGEDFDRRVVDHFVEIIKRKHGVDVGGDGRALHRLRRECERAKRALSVEHLARVEVESLLDGVNFSETLTRAEFEELNEDLFARAISSVRKTMADAGLEKCDVDEIILSGGSTMIPKVRQLLIDYFDGKEPNHGVNPDEAVAYGAALRAAQASGQFNNDRRHDLIPDIASTVAHTTSIEIATAGSDGGEVTPMISRWSHIPAEKTHVFTTYLGWRETAVTIRVVAKHNTLVGELELTGIRPASIWNWGWRPIEVTVKVDRYGDILVEATDKDSGKSENLSINQSDRLSQEIERMVREAEELTEEKRIVRERSNAKNMLESYIHSVKNAVTGSEEMNWEEKVKAEEAVTAASEWLDGNLAGEKAEFEEKMRELKTVCETLMAAVQERRGRRHDEL
uniref:Uncharacterized protein n=1 Tax=Leersia perrieri TaxID=77586 RepID=A0A0D9V1K6_9ORYZ